MNLIDADDFKFQRMKIVEEIRGEFPIEKIMRYSRILQNDDRDWSRCNLFAQLLLQKILRIDKNITGKIKI